MSLRSPSSGDKSPKSTSGQRGQDEKELRPPGWKRYIILSCCVLMHLVAGNLVCFGNVSPYFASYQTYLKIRSDPSLTVAETYSNTLSNCQYIFAAAISCASIGALIGGPMETRLGPRLTVIIACLLETIGCLATYFTCGSLFGSIFTYGICFGLGAGIAYGICLVVAIKWFPERQGFASGVVLAAFGSGAFFLENIQTHYVNPDNADISSMNGYMDNVKVLHRTPFLFLVLASVFLAVQLVSVPWLTFPPINFLQMQIDRYSRMSGDSASKTQLSLVNYASSQSILQYSAKDVLQLCSFWHIEMISFLSFVPTFFVIQSWKLFSVEYIGITNDNFLALLGACGALCSGIGRIFWGFFYDKFNRNFRLSMLTLSGIQTVIIITLPLLPTLGGNSETRLKTLLFIWVSLMFFCNGYFSFIPSTMSTLFGEKHATTFVGYVMMAQIPAIFLDSFLCANVNSQWIGGWNHGMVGIGLLCALSWLLTVGFQTLPGDGIAKRNSLCDCWVGEIKSWRVIMTPTQSRFDDNTDGHSAVEPSNSGMDGTRLYSTNVILITPPSRERPFNGEKEPLSLVVNSNNAVNKPNYNSFSNLQILRK